MGTTAEKLQAIVAAKEDIGAAIAEKGGTVPQKLSEYGNAIRALPGGGAGTPPTPLDAQKLYSATRDTEWPPMPEDVAEHTIVLLYVGGGIAAFTVASEGQYTVEVKLCTYADGAWSYEVESTEAVESEQPYFKEFPAEENPKYRLMTISASSISDFVPAGESGTGGRMPGCVEFLCRLPGMKAPVLRDMGDLVYVTELGESSGSTPANLFQNCASLICVIAPDLNLMGGLSRAFSECHQLMAVDISLDPNTSHSLTYTFSSCSKLTFVPPSIAKYGSAFTYAFARCWTLREAYIENNTGKSFGFGYAFQNCYALERVTFTGNFGFSLLASAFAGCISLRHLIFNLQNWKGINFSVANCAFDRAGLVEMFESLPITSLSRTINITGNPGVAELTEEDKAIATDKNWTLVLE